MIKVYNERYSLINNFDIYLFIKDNLKEILRGNLNNMTYLKLEGSPENFEKLDKLIQDAKTSRTT